MSTVYLITGASRGLGKALVRAYLQYPDSTVIAAVRNPEDDSSKTLYQLPKTSSTLLIVVKLDSASQTDARDTILKLQSAHNIHSLDIVVANAGISKLHPKVEEAAKIDLLEHYEINVVGTVILFQSVLPLLRKSQKTPKFIAMSSGSGSIEIQDHSPFPNAVYGPSKAALNWLLKRIHVENGDLIAFPIHPGWVRTEGGSKAAKTFGLDESAVDQVLISIEESISGVVKLIDTSTKESHSGKFLNYDGTTFPW